MPARAITTKVRFSVRDKLVIADPCYIDENDTLEGLGDNGLILDDCAGEWEAEITPADHPYQGRVSALVARKLPVSNYGSGDSRVENANGVDSSQMFVGCASSYPIKYYGPNSLLSMYSSIGVGDDDPRWHETYDHPIQMLAYKEGAVSSTGMGDGTYPVIVDRDLQQQAHQGRGAVPRLRRLRGRRRRRGRRVAPGFKRKGGEGIVTLLSAVVNLLQGKE
jgi:hypothetical protein